MEKRKTKTQFGTVGRMTSTNYQERDILPGLSFCVEYLRKANEKAEEKSHLCGSLIEPWELRDSYRTDSIGKFIREVCVRLLDDDTVDMWPYAETETAETFVELPTDIRHTLRNLVNREMNSRMSAMERQMEEATKEIETMRGFIKKYHADEMYKKYKEEHYAD